MKIRLLWALLVLAGPLAAQRDSISPAGTPAPVYHQQLNCDSLHPLVFVHGFMASGDTWRAFNRYFQNDGYCLDNMYAFDWNTLDRLHDHGKTLDAFIDTILARTGATQVDLFGHSAGGALCYKYLENPDRAVKVAHYVHLASMPQKAPPGPEGQWVPTLNVWSDADYVVKTDSIPGATNIRMKDLDHYQVATDRSVYQEVFSFLQAANAWEPGRTPIAPYVAVNCKVVVFGSNKPVEGASVVIKKLDSNDRGATQSITDSNGCLPTLTLTQPLTDMEFVVQQPGERDIHYYFSRFEAAEPFIYLRVLPPPVSPLGLLLMGLPKSEDACVVNIFSANRSLIAGRDQVWVNGIQLINDTIAPAEKTAISFFLYDANGNKQSDLTPVARFEKFPFLAGVDCWFEYMAPIPAPKSKRRNKNKQGLYCQSPVDLSRKFDGLIDIYGLYIQPFRVPRIPANEGIMIFVLD